MWRGSGRATWCVRRADAGGVCGWDTLGPEPGMLAGAGFPGRQAVLSPAWLPDEADGGRRGSGDGEGVLHWAPEWRCWLLPQSRVLS